MLCDCIKSNSNTYLLNFNNRHRTRAFIIWQCQRSINDKCLPIYLLSFLFVRNPIWGKKGDRMAAIWVHACFDAVFVVIISVEVSLWSLVLMDGQLKFTSEQLISFFLEQITTKWKRGGRIRKKYWTKPMDEINSYVHSLHTCGHLLIWTPQRNWWFIDMR